MTLAGARELLSHYGVGLFRRLDAQPVFLMAGGLAFAIVTCTVPFTLTVFAILGHLFRTSMVAGPTATMMDALLPYERQSDLLRDFLMARGRELAQHRGALGIVGLAGMLLAASSVFSAMRTILNTVFGLRPQGLPLAGKARDLALLFLVLWLLLLAVILSPAMEAVQASPLVSSLLGRPFATPLQQLLYDVGSLVLVWASFFGLYRFLPQGRIGKRVAAFTAVWAAGLWQVADAAFGYYLAHFANLTRLYGAYALGAAALFWFYYSAIVFVLAAEIGQLYRERLPG